jgi:periplasmic divalent cation tolerance protein
MNSAQLCIGWTTVSKRSEAEALARLLIEHKLSVCVHIEGPITAYYNWKGILEQDEEYRLMIKFFQDQEANIETLFQMHHPYKVPQWIMVESNYVSNAYLDWAKDSIVV